MFDIGQEQAEKIIQSFQIPAKPQMLTELQNEQKKPDPSVTVFAEIISKDVALSAGILKAINSPLYGLNRTVSDIKQSVIMLGTDNVANIALFIMLRNLSSSSPASISHERYWDTAMETAAMIELLLPLLDLQNNCPVEDAYAFGLFRDCGIPLMAMRYADYQQVLIAANADPTHIFTSFEDNRYQTNHAVIGYFIANSWNLPRNLCELILRHHDPYFLDDDSVNHAQKDLYALAKVASNVLHQYKLMEDDSEWYQAKQPVLAYLGLNNHDYQEIEEDVKELFAKKISPDQ